MSVGTTPKGFPFPNGDDLVTNGDNVIAALAAEVDNTVGRTACGKVTVSFPTAGATNSVAVTFPVGRFTATPWVAGMGIWTDPTKTTFSVGTTPTISGFNLYVNNPYTTDKTVSWIAIQV